MTPTPKSKNSFFDKQGHRGCRGLLPENTIPAMIRALELGVTTLEMDAVITRDSQVVLSHEPFFNHEITTKPDGSPVSEKEEKELNIYRMDYAEVSRYDVGLLPHPRFPQQEKLRAIKPLLGDVMDTVLAYCRQHHRKVPTFNIETKTSPYTDGIYHPSPSLFVDLLMKLIAEKNMLSHVLIQSFDFRTLQYLHLKYPAIPTAMLIDDGDKRDLKQQLSDLGFTPAVYSPHFSLVNTVLIEACHRQSMKIIPWTVNEKALMFKLKAQGVDGIITDYPHLF
jgi:glycerophosphoryl diester phosphodiesterase